MHIPLAAVLLAPLILQQIAIEMVACSRVQIDDTAYLPPFKRRSSGEALPALRTTGSEALTSPTFVFATHKVMRVSVRSTYPVVPFVIAGVATAIFGPGSVRSSMHIASALLAGTMTVVIVTSFTLSRRSAGIPPQRAKYQHGASGRDMIRLVTDSLRLKDIVTIRRAFRLMARLSVTSARYRTRVAG